LVAFILDSTETEAALNKLLRLEAPVVFKKYRPTTHQQVNTENAIRKFFIANQFAQK